MYVLAAAAIAGIIYGHFFAKDNKHQELIVKICVFVLMFAIGFVLFF